MRLLIGDFLVVNAGFSFDSIDIHFALSLAVVDVMWLRLEATLVCRFHCRSSLVLSFGARIHLAFSTIESFYIGTNLYTRFIIMIEIESLIITSWCSHMMRRRGLTTFIFAISNFFPFAFEIHCSFALFVFKVFGANAIIVRRFDAVLFRGLRFVFSVVHLDTT